MDGFRETGDVRNSVPGRFFVATAFAAAWTTVSFIHVVESSEMSQQGAIAISYHNVVNLFIILQMEICKVDVDDIAFGNFDTLRFMDTVGVVSWEILYTYRIEYIK